MQRTSAGLELGTGTGILAQVFYQLVLRVLSRQSRDVLQLLHMLIFQHFNFFLFFNNYLCLALQVFAYIIHLTLLTIHVFQPLVERLFFLLNAVFALVNIIVFTVYFLLMLGFHL